MLPRARAENFDRSLSIFRRPSGKIFWERARPGLGRSIRGSSCHFIIGLWAFSLHSSFLGKKSRYRNWCQRVKSNLFINSQCQAAVSVCRNGRRKHSLVSPVCNKSPSSVTGSICCECERPWSRERDNQKNRIMSGSSCLGSITLTPLFRIRRLSSISCLSYPTLTCRTLATNFQVQ